MQKWLEMSWLMPGQLENIIIACIVSLRFLQIMSVFLYCVVTDLYTCMSCNHLSQYSITLSHLLIVSLFSSFKQNTVNCVHVCSCMAYGACGFTHYTSVCSANSSKHYHHWRRGIFINLLLYFQMTCVASIAAHGFSSRKRFVRVFIYLYDCQRNISIYLCDNQWKIRSDRDQTDPSEIGGFN
jgi:hypothetical protein